MLNISVEIGSEEQADYITNELSVINKIAELLDPSPTLTQIIVPADFDKKVNEIQNTTEFTSQRGQIVVAKIIETSEGISIVFSPYLYTAAFDMYMRLFTYFHELRHAFNRSIFPFPLKKSVSFYQNAHNLYTLYDEYSANRWAFEVLHNFYHSTSFHFKKSMIKDLEGHINSLVENDCYYDKIKEEISSFRYHGDISYFIEVTNPFFDEVSKSLIYAYAYIDYCPRLSRFLETIKKSYFHNDRSHHLIEFYREKYRNKEVDLFDGIELIDQFMTNFGMKFEDVDGGLYCHVLDI